MNKKKEPKNNISQYIGIFLVAFVFGMVVVSNWEIIKEPLINIIQTPLGMFLIFLIIVLICLNMIFLFLISLFKILEDD